jgi:D-inositol-3-phosphate glycosyltransferase
LGLPAGPLLLFVGRLEPLKGVDILLRAAAIADVDEPVRVLVAGGDERLGEERARLEALTVDLGMNDRVRFDSAVAHEALPDYYRAADLCVVPSYYESFGLVAVEALASGTPVVATRVGGLQYTVKDGQTGYLVPWRCPEPFAERIETLLANGDLRRRFSEAAPQSVMSFRWPDVAQRISRVYEHLLAADDPQPHCGSDAAQGAAVSAGARIKGY